MDAAGDHRIMAAAVASGACAGPVTVTGAQAVEKSYPTFWQELRKLGKSGRNPRSPLTDRPGYFIMRTEL